MCGRKFAADELNWADYREQLEIIKPDSNLQPSYNIAPTQTYNVCIEQGGERLLKPMRWWLVPPWAKKLSSKYPAFNARSETLEEKVSFKGLLKANRCAVMVSGFYEWEPRTKQPYAVWRADRKPMIFAGLWCENKHLGLTSYTIATSEAPDSFKHLHHRCPVILQPSQVATWLSGPWEDAKVITQPYAGSFESVAVSKDVGKVQNNSSALLEPVPI